MSAPASASHGLRDLWSAQRYRVLGVVFVALILLAVYLVYAVFTQKFTRFDVVTLQTSTIGLQLPEQADVKIRGVEVGEVLDFSVDPGGKAATVKLGIFPDKIDTIPADVTGEIVPKTLFGEKYVALQTSSSAAQGHIEPGAVIERTKVSTEVEAVLSDLYPLLRTIDPASLNNTLNALSTALEGRGDELGRSIVTLDSYLKRFNPKLPILVADLRKTASVSDTYADVLPQVASILRNTITTTTTLEDRSVQLHRLLADVTDFSNTANTFLKDNGNNLIQVGDVTAPVAAMLAKYAPEFPCLLAGLDKLGEIDTLAWRNYTLHVTIETLPRQPRAYTTKDKPVYADNRGPGCGHLPNPPWSQSNVLKTVPNIADGVDSPTGKGTDRASWSGYATPMAYAGSPAETEALDTLLAPGMGTTADKVDDLGALLVGPLVRGAKVSMR